MNISKVVNNKNQDRARKIATTLGKSGTLLPIVLLETTVTGGRSLQAYKRDGYVEARERFCEESIVAVVWLFGVRAFNKLCDFLGKHVLKIPEVNFDVGKDALRTPFENLMADNAKKAQTDKNIKVFSKKALTGFKLGKIILSVLAATSFMGIVVPKINQAITRKVLSRTSSAKKNKDESRSASSESSVKNSSTEEVKNETTSKKESDKEYFVKPADSKTPGVFTSISNFKKDNNTNNPAFKSAFTADSLAIFAHNLENHPVYNLLSTDTGLLAGRTVNARNNDERVEIIFRDLASIYFYMFCTKHVVNFMQKSGKFGSVAKLDPMSAKLVHEKILTQLNESGGQMSVTDFKNKVLGSISDERKAILDGLENLFKENNDVISLNDLKKHLPDKLYNKAKAMSGLQPKQAKLGAVLTKQQFEDVLREGCISEPDFLIDMNKQYFGMDSATKTYNLTNRYKFIPMKRIQTYRNNIEDYVKAIAEYAKSLKGDEANIVTEKTLEKMNKSNLRKHGGFFAAGFLVSALFLSTIIPKTQYLITKLRTGKDEFPGKKDGGVRQKIISK